MEVKRDLEVCGTVSSLGPGGPVALPLSHPIPAGDENPESRIRTLLGDVRVAFVRAKNSDIFFFWLKIKNVHIDMANKGVLQGR